MIYLDANFFAFGILNLEEKGEKARKIHSDIIKGKKAVTSPLTLDEFMWVLIKNNRKELIRKAVLDVYSTPNLEIREVSSSVPIAAIEFIEKYGLKPRDAFHLAIMKELKINEIVTDDPHFDKISGIKRIKL